MTPITDDEAGLSERPTPLEAMASQASAMSEQLARVLDAKNDSQ